MKIQEFDYTVDLEQAITWRYDQATSLKKLIELKQLWYQQAHTDFWDDWYNNVFNLPTANYFGVIVWAIILNLSVYIGPNYARDKIFGYGPKTNKNKNFTHGNFLDSSPYSGLTTAEKRLILRLRYFGLCCRGAIPEINAFIVPLFNELTLDTGTVYVIDNLDMTITYVFTYSPDPRLIEIFQMYDILPRPAGVDVIITTP